MDPDHVKSLERSTAGEQAVHGLPRDDGVVELELRQSRQKKRGRGNNLAEIAGREAGEAQRGHEAERGRRQRALRLSTCKQELL